jgi:hypothetical protein
MTLTDRISLLEICDREFPGGNAVEIGVAGGHFSRQILATWKSIGALVLVDAWKHFEEGYSDGCNLDQEIQDERYDRVCLDFKDEQRVSIVRKLSTEASRFYEPETFHLVYLDANHSTKAAREDLEHWWPLLRPGGIFAGHDYLPGNGEGYGVKRAVDQFAAEWDLKVWHTMHEYCRSTGVYGACWEGCSFAIRKPA